jgi:ABC-type uncharacterized transport system permease subunit
VASLVSAPAGEVDPVVRSPGTGVHVLVTLLSYGSFALAFISGALFLVQQRRLKTHAQSSVLTLMPSLETARKITTRALAAGVLLMTAGIVVGYLYGRSRSHHLPEGWRVDAKVWSATLSWALYVAVFALSFKGRRTAIASVAGFVVVMALFWIAAFYSNFHRFL